MSFGLIVLGVVFGAVACGEERTSHPEPQQAFEQLVQQPPERAAATVGGEKLGQRAFQRYWDRHPEMERDEVVDAVIERRVAAQRSLQDERAASFDDLGYVRKRTIVQRLLQNSIESRWTREDLETEEIESKMETLRQQARRPPGLKASHLLVMLPKSVRQSDDSKRRDELSQKARAWSQNIRQQLPGAPSVERLYRALQTFESKVPSPLKVVVNARLEFPRPSTVQQTSNLPEDWRQVVPGFGRGAEQLAQSHPLGTLSEPVESTYGWHLVVVHETLPERVPEPEKLRELAIEKLLKQKRHELLKTRAREWQKGTTFSTHPGVFDDRGASSPSSEGTPSE